MDFSQLLSSGQLRRDQQPNKSLAGRIANDPRLLPLFMEYLLTIRDKKIETDALMVLRALSEIDPGMLKEYVTVFVEYLNSPINQRIWASMIILNNLTSSVPKMILPHLPVILECMDKGTVITKDHGFSLLCKLHEFSHVKSDTGSLIMEQLLRAPVNQIGQYTEKFYLIVQPHEAIQMDSILSSRMGDLPKPSHRKRLSSILLKLRKKFKSNV